MPSSTIPNDPTTTPACRMPHGRAKEPEPILAFAKLKKVAISLWRGEEGKEGGREGETWQKRAEFEHLQASGCVAHPAPSLL